MSKYTIVNKSLFYKFSTSILYAYNIKNHKDNVKLGQLNKNDQQNDKYIIIMHN